MSKAFTKEPDGDDDDDDGCRPAAAAAGRKNYITPQPATSACAPN
jgi:hypothetical protein